ncbi:MAG: hypothetical protein RJA83_1166 [Pseudomonadota bacterium]|jgi:hypothetical protein
MTYITSIERLGVEEGLQRGRQEERHEVAQWAKNYLRSR